MADTTQKAEVRHQNFGGIRRDVVETNLGPSEESPVSQARDAQNMVNPFQSGALSPRPGLSRIIFGEAYTTPGRIDGVGFVRTAERTRVLFSASDGTLYRYTDPVRVVEEQDT